MAKIHDLPDDDNSPVHSPTELNSSNSASLQNLNSAESPVSGELVEKINYWSEQAYHHGEKMLEAAKNCGACLLQVRKQVGHGKWMNWVRMNFRWKGSARGLATAERFMSIAREWHYLQKQEMENCSVDKALQAIKRKNCVDPRTRAVGSILDQFSEVLDELSDEDLATFRVSCSQTLSRFLKKEVVGCTTLGDRLSHTQDEYAYQRFFVENSSIPEVKLCGWMRRIKREERNDPDCYDLLDGEQLKIYLLEKEKYKNAVTAAEREYDKASAICDKLQRQRERCSDERFAQLSLDLASARECMVASGDVLSRAQEALHAHEKIDDSDSKARPSLGVF